MSWTPEAHKRAVERVFSGPRTFALILEDGTEYADGPRAAGTLSLPLNQGGVWRVCNEEAVEFAPFARTAEQHVTAIAVYAGPIRLALIPTAPVAVSDRVQVVLRPGELWVGA